MGADLRLADVRWEYALRGLFVDRALDWHTLDPDDLEKLLPWLDYFIEGRHEELPPELQLPKPLELGSEDWCNLCGSIDPVLAHMAAARVADVRHDPAVVRKALKGTDELSGYVCRRHGRALYRRWGLRIPHPESEYHLRGWTDRTRGAVDGSSMTVRPYAHLATRDPSDSAP